MCLAYLEIWYHVAAVLSCRFSGPGTPHYARRLTSSDQILAIIGNSGYESLPPLPLIPYAMSMSMTVLYRAFRDGERAIDSTITNLQHCYDTLKGLSRHWTSVRGLARMAKRVLKHITNIGPDDTNDSTARKVPKMILKPNGTFVPDGQRSEEGFMVGNFSAIQEPFPSIHANGLPATELPSVVSPDIRGQMTELPWSGVDGLNYPFEWVINDMFDFGMPNLFRDPMV